MQVCECCYRKEEKTPNIDLFKTTSKKKTKRTATKPSASPVSYEVINEVYRVFTHVPTHVQSYCNKRVYTRKEFMTAISSFWNTNMAAVRSCACNPPTSYTFKPRTSPLNQPTTSVCSTC